MTDFQSQYPLILKQDVIWRDLDAYGHVNNAVFFRYFEDARMHFNEQVGMGELKISANIGPILATTHCDFRRPLGYPDRILIGARSVVQGPKKIFTEYAVYSESLQAVAAEGSSLMLCYDYNNNRSCELPEHIVSAIESLHSS